VRIINVMDCSWGKCEFRTTSTAARRKTSLGDEAILADIG